MRGGSQGAAARGRGGSRGRGRGRGGFAVRGGNKPTFESTRVEEHVEHGSHGSEKSEEDDQDEPVHKTSEDISSDDEDRTTSFAKPYNILLQSLNTNVQRGQPQRKKRKIDGNANEYMASVVTDDSVTEPQAHGDLDEVEEPEEGSDLGSEGPLVAEDVEDDDDGTCACCFA